MDINAQYHIDLLTAQFPITDDIAEMEEWARLALEIDEYGFEWYAVYTCDDDGWLIRLTDWLPFEQAWECYTALFVGDLAFEDDVETEDDFEEQASFMRRVMGWVASLVW